MAPCPYFSVYVMGIHQLNGGKTEEVTFNPVVEMKNLISNLKKKNGVTASQNPPSVNNNSDATIASSNDPPEEDDVEGDIYLEDNVNSTSSVPSSPRSFTATVSTPALSATVPSNSSSRSSSPLSISDKSATAPTLLHSVANSPTCHSNSLSQLPVTPSQHQVHDHSYFSPNSHANPVLLDISFQRVPFEQDEESVSEVTVPFSNF